MMFLKFVSYNNVCRNLPGTFECACSEGYEGDGHRNCKDIDECMGVNAFALCGRTRTCMNTPGSYDCICEEGYRETIQESKKEKKTKETKHKRSYLIVDSFICILGIFVQNLTSKRGCLFLSTHFLTFL